MNNQFKLKYTANSQLKFVKKQLISALERLETLSMQTYHYRDGCKLTTRATNSKHANRVIHANFANPSLIFNFLSLKLRESSNVYQVYAKFITQKTLIH